MIAVTQQVLEEAVDFCPLTPSVSLDSFLLVGPTLDTHFGPVFGASLLNYSRSPDAPWLLGGWGIFWKALGSASSRTSSL
jgi:hypothetical protein